VCVCVCARARVCVASRTCIETCKCRCHPTPGKNTQAHKLKDSTRHDVPSHGIGTSPQHLSPDQAPLSCLEEAARPVRHNQPSDQRSTGRAHLVSFALGALCIGPITLEVNTRKHRTQHTAGKKGGLGRMWCRSAKSNTQHKPETCACACARASVTVTDSDSEMKLDVCVVDVVLREETKPETVGLIQMH
jgi:hypothetical protein